MHTNINDFLLNENIKQMREYLHAIGSEELENSLGFIKDKFKKKPNYISIFTKLMVDRNGKVHGSEQQFDEVADWIINRNHLVSKLPKKVQDYESLEEIQDDIRRIDINDLVEKYYHSLYATMRDQIDKLDKEEKESMDNTVASFMLLDENLRKSFPPLKYFIKNGLTISDMKNAMESFIQNGEVNASKEGVMSVIEGNKNVTIAHDMDNVLIIQTNDEDVILKLGSNRWCIVYSPTTYFHKYVGGENLYAQFICFNFNLPQSSRNSLIGLSIDIGNSPIDGGCQDRENKALKMSEVCDILNVDRSVFTNPFHEVIFNIISAKDCIKKILEYSRTIDIDALAAICNKDQVNIGIISQMDKLLVNTTPTLFGDEFNIYDYLVSLDMDFDTGHSPVYIYIEILKCISVAIKKTKIGGEEFGRFINDHLTADDVLSIIDDLIPEDYYDYPSDYESYADVVELFNLDEVHDYNAFNYIINKHATKGSEIQKKYHKKLVEGFDLDKDNKATYKINDFSDLEFLFDTSLDIITDPDTYESYGSNDDWEHSLDFSAKTVFAIYKKLLDEGIELDEDNNNLYEEFSDSEFNNLGYDATMALYKEDGEFIKAFNILNKYVVDIIENPYDYEAEDTVEEIRDAINSSQRSAYDSAMTGEYYDNFISSLDKLFEYQKVEGSDETKIFTISEDNKMVLKFDMSKIIDESDDNLAYIVRNYDEDFDAENVLEFYADHVGKLSFREPEYASVDNELLNEYISENI